jgi:CubicO group peptidase (beta-lactamase class C family)
MKSIICILINLIFVYSIDWTNVDNVINEAIYDGVFSGAVLAVVSQNSTFLKKAYGTTTPTRGLYATPVTVDMKFDINLLSQVVGTGTCLMQMYDTQTVSMSKRIASSLPDFNNNGKGLITLDNMMSHNSGIQAQYNDTFGKNTD